MKKLTSKIAMFMLICIVFTCIAPANAIAGEIQIDSTRQAELKAAEVYAYMDYETADAATQEKILEARNTIIFSRSWVSDGMYSCVMDPDGNVVRVTPQFSEVFPADWELPKNPVVIDSATVSPEAQDDNAIASTRAAWRLDQEYYYETLQNPPLGSNSPPFTFRTNTSPGNIGYISDIAINTKTYEQGSSWTWNGGFSSVNGQGFEPDIPNGYSYYIPDVPTDALIALRASTYDTPAYCTLDVGCVIYD